MIGFTLWSRVVRRGIFCGKASSEEGNVSVKSEVVANTHGRDAEEST